ncbi:MAG: ATP-binding protein, partial [Myxococcaceae bacterium]
MGVSELGLPSSSASVVATTSSARVVAQPSDASLDAFHEELRSRNQQLFFWSSVIFNSVYVMWTAFDYLLAREHWLQFLPLRFAASGLNTLVLVAARRPALKRYTFEAFWGWLFVFGVFVVPMLTQVDAGFVAYVLGFSIVLFGVGLVPMWPPDWAGSILVAIRTGAGGGLAFAPPHANSRDFVAGTFFAITSAVMSAVLATSKYYLVKRHYFTRLQLRDEQMVSERLREADRIKDEFLANVSHELRTPLNGIIGLSESMLDGAAGKPTPAQASNLAMIATSGRRLANLVNDLLDFSKLKNHEVQLAVRSTDLKPNIDIVIALLTPLVESKPLKLINRLDESLPLALADENRLQQILFNLIGNGIKFTERGTVEVTARLVAPLIEITVRDTGIGIARDDFGRIFESFQQGDASASRNYGGTGLGLAVTRQLVELHGGTINVTSTVGEGSAFTFTLPLGETRTESDSAVGLDLLQRRVMSTPVTFSTPLPAPAGAAEVLVVDDESINLQVVTNMLSIEGFKVSEARSGPEALDKLEKGYRPALVLLDVMMPKMSGFDVLKELRKKFRAADLPVILLTSKNQVSDLIQGFESGANDYVTKPIAKGELLSRIRAHLETARTYEAYGRFVPHQFLRHLGLSNILEVNLGDQVQKEMAILFSDIRSFTTLSEEMTPAETFNFLNSFLSRVAPVIAHNAGFIDQYIGDAVMALFPGNVDDALNAAIELRAAVRLYNEHRGMSGYKPIKIGTGLHTGPLILGTIGYEARLQTTVVADSVNLASRLEGLTKTFGIEVAISEELLARVRDPSRYNFRTLGQVRVKGKRRSVHVYELLDGAVDEELKLRLATRQTFELGVMHLLERQYSQAVASLEDVIQRDPTDQAAEHLLKRARDFEKN